MRAETRSFCNWIDNFRGDIHHSKKRKDILETRDDVLLIFSLELEISGVAVQSIHQNCEKWCLFRFLSLCTHMASTLRGRGSGGGGGCKAKMICYRKYGGDGLVSVLGLHCYFFIKKWVCVIARHQAEPNSNNIQEIFLLTVTSDS